MTIEEFSDQFDLLYNNITSNQAPGLSEFEKSVFATKAEKEIVKNYFSPQSPGNNLKEGFDESAKRQADFSMLMKTSNCTKQNTFSEGKIDDRSTVWSFPTDMFIAINEAIKTTNDKRLQVIPLKYDEYTRLMSKPYKRPLKNQGWRLINSGAVAADSGTGRGTATKYVEIITNSWDSISTYSIRYIKTPSPILLADFTADGLSIDGQSTKSPKIDIDPILHEDILQRAVELAKVAWTSTGQDNVQLEMTAGQRSE